MAAWAVLAVVRRTLWNEPYVRRQDIEETPLSTEHEGILCRACGHEERASEGYPCSECGTFICLVCSIRGVTLCKECQVKRADAPDRADRDGSGA